MASFIMMSPRKPTNGTILQSLDVLDFSVVHLSAYERLKRRWRKVLPDFINNKSKNKKDWETGFIFIHIIYIYIYMYSYYIIIIIIIIIIMINNNNYNNNDNNTL